MLGNLLMSTILAGAILISGDAFAKTTTTTSSKLTDTVTIRQSELMLVEGNVRNFTDHDMMVNTAKGNVLVNFADWGGFDPRDHFKAGNRVRVSGIVVGHLDSIPVVKATNAQAQKNGERFVLDGYPEFDLSDAGLRNLTTTNRGLYEPIPSEIREFEAITPAAGPMVSETEVIESHVETYKSRPVRDFKPPRW